jgi:SAM-dependent methyltransferase
MCHRNESTPHRLMPEEPNIYSGRWFEFFHSNIDQARTRRETEFISKCAPLPGFKRILDLCCGEGRHARGLSSRGYTVTGMDRDPGAIAKARELDGGPNYVVTDIRNCEFERGQFDAVIVMGQSFGHFDEPTNRDVLRRLNESIPTHGRVVLDLWNPEFFESHEGDRELKTSRGIVHESKQVKNGRLFVRLNYPDGARDKFEWQLFTPPEMKRLARSAGLELLVSCTSFDEKIVPWPGDPRIQFLLEQSA